MDEKHLLGGLAWNSQQRRASRPKHSVIIPFLLLCLWIPSHGRLNIVLSRNELRFLEYNGEYIRWEPCGDIDGSPFECSGINVPMDQFDLENSGSKTFAIPLIRMRGSNATQNLLLNPGWLALSPRRAAEGYSRRGFPPALVRPSRG
jgi:hypothetical protein